MKDIIHQRKGKRGKKMPMENKKARVICKTCGHLLKKDLRTIQQLQQSVGKLLKLPSRGVNWEGQPTYDLSSRDAWFIIHYKIEELIKKSKRR